MNHFLRTLWMYAFVFFVGKAYGEKRGRTAVPF